MIAAMTVVMVTTRETPRAWAKAGSATTTRKLSIEPPNGRKVGFVDWRVTLERKAELIIQ